MASFKKRKLSGAGTGNLGIKIVATGSTGTTIHTAVAGTTAGTFDEIWLYAFNSDTVAHTLTIEFGATTAPNCNIIMALASKSGLQLVVPGLILQNGAIVTAFADVANVVTLNGFVNTMTD